MIMQTDIQSGKILHILSAIRPFSLPQKECKKSFRVAVLEYLI